MVRGPIVFVLGAGASAHCGVPLLADFLATSRDLFARRHDLRFRSSFERLFEWIDSLRPAGNYVSLDRSNLEVVFSLIELARQLDPGQYEPLHLAVNQVVLETLDDVRMTWADDSYYEHITYDAFVSRLRARHQKRRLEFPALVTAADTLITLNYDLALDTALTASGTPYSYCLDQMPDESRHDSFRLLKLHGSINWLYCQQCGNGPQVLPVRDAISGLATRGMKAPLRIVTEVLPQRRCAACGAVGALFPRLIPPTWSKAVAGRPAETRVWNEALQAIESAERLVVIGYSLPATDTFFRYLLTLGLKNSRALEDVRVINRRLDGAGEARYREIFSPNQLDGSRFVIQQMTFEMFMSRDDALD